jgi:hypothetical protein
MIRPPLTAIQREAFRQLLSLADRRGLTANWAPDRAIEIAFAETDAMVPMVQALLEVETTWPGLLEVLQTDPAIRFEVAAPRVAVWLSSWARELIQEGYFHGSI